MNNTNKLNFQKMSAVEKVQLLYSPDFMEKYQISNYELKNIISSLPEKTRAELLMDTDLITNTLHLPNTQLTKLVKELSSEEYKSKILEVYDKLEEHLKVEIITTFNNNSKLNILLNSNNFMKFNKIDILKSFDTETLIQFLVNHKQFCTENNIHPYEIICKLDIEKQKSFAENLENINLTFSEKKEIIVTLNENVKSNIDTTKIPEKYKSALTIPITKYGKKVILDLERNLEDYRGLDNLITINPTKFPEHQKDKLFNICDICPNLSVVNELYNAEEISTGSEYKEAEQWINSIIDNINPEYSKAQKMAIIDNAIGKKISYTPNFGTEMFNSNDCRALWKIIASGYGVCNGISLVEQYMLKRVGIDSELVSSGSHVFLKVKNIELPLSNGETVRGNTILDPTWNLTSHKFGGKPDNFCIDYNQARKNDIDPKGKDHNCHKNDEQLQDATLNLDEQSLRKLFASVGLADKNGQFPINDFLEKSKQIDKMYANQPEENINKQFLLLKQTCPDFATCQNSSMNILSNNLLSNENMRFNKCVVNRVYNRKDKEKTPTIFVYIDSNEFGKKFYFADKEKGEFIELPQKEFTEQFECYEKDLESHNGFRPWEPEYQSDIDLSTNSGKIVAEEEPTK